MRQNIIPSNLDDSTKRNVFTAPEYGIISIPLDEILVDGKLNLYPEVIGKKYFNFYLKQNNLIFQAGGYVGIIPINDRVTLDIRPRVPVENLERIFQIINEVPLTVGFYPRLYARHPTSSSSILDVLTKTLMESMRMIEQHGLQKEYIERVADTSFPHGRIRIEDTFRTHLNRGRNHIIKASWFEHSVDTAPNRCLKYVLWILSRRYKKITSQKGQRKILSDLNRLYHLFEKVTLDQSLAFLRDSLVIHPHKIPSIRSYYIPLLQIATSIIQNSGVAFNAAGTEITLPSIIFDFDVVFEKFLRRILDENIKILDENFKVLDGNVSGINGGAKSLFDKSLQKERATPDIVIKKKDESINVEYKVILDAKYKPILNPDREDINQVVTYGLSYKCSNLVIIYPKSGNQKSGLFEVGEINNYKLYKYIFDLANPNPEIEEVNFAKAVLELAS